MALANGLGRLPALRERLVSCSSALLASLREELDDLTELRELIGRAIVDEPPSPSGRAASSGRATTRRWTACGTLWPTERAWWPPSRPGRRKRPASRA
ncbi:hypothetical protein M5E87_08175 [Flavonifractor plautii]|nr:hypothetical protein M5E87_08175 [Flavonifractor plautii]